MEQIAPNFAETTLASSLTDSATSLTIASADTGKFPSSGEFRVVLTDVDETDFEYLKVTAVSSDTWTVVREAEDATRFGKRAWASGSRVVGILTRGGLLQLLQDASWQTGDVKVSLATSALSGWVKMDDGTIGSASSGATTRANADCQSLFTLLWNGVSNSWCAVSGGRGANAAADWSANKTIALPRSLGRALAVSGAGSTLTSRALAQYLGAETHSLTAGENGPHQHDVNYATSGGAGVQPFTLINASTYTGTAALVGISGSGTPHNNMQPTLFLNLFIKL